MTKYTPQESQLEFQFEKLCECGCGLPAKNRYRQGHNSKYAVRTPEERFWQFVQKTDTCWLWTGATAPFGYGLFGVEGKAERAHRFSWEIHNGPIPEGLFVCHHCDVPACIRPDHLFLGTDMDNVHDMISKGRNWIDDERRAKGERHGMAKLTEEIVLEIRTKYAENKPTFTELGKQYGLGHHAIWNIVHYKIWKQVPGPDAPPKNLTLGENNIMAKLTAEQVLAIRAEYAAGNHDRKQLGAKYDVSHMAIYRIIKGYTWRHLK